jgi:hypothetical protein
MFPLLTIILGFIVLTGYLFFRLIPDGQEAALRRAMPATRQQKGRIARIHNGLCPNCGSSKITRLRRSIRDKLSTTDSGHVILENPMIGIGHQCRPHGRVVVEEWNCEGCRRIVHEVRFRT